MSAAAAAERTSVAMHAKWDSIDELGVMSRAIQHKPSVEDQVREKHDARKKKYNKKHDRQAGMPGMKMVFGTWKRKVFGKAMSQEQMIKAFAEQAVEEYNMQLSKGNPRGGKYFRRIATGNPKRPWKYYYTKEQYQKEHGDSAHLHGGDSLKEIADRANAEEAKVGAGKNDWSNPEVARRASQKLAEGAKGSTPDWLKKVREQAKAPQDTGKQPKYSKKDTKLMQADVEAARKYASGGKKEVSMEEHNRRMEAERTANMARYSTTSRTPLSAQLSKGMEVFTHEHKVRTEWLPEFVDAFIEEAHKHLSSEQRDPHLQKSFSTAEVFDEFVAYAKLNKSLAQAQASIPVTAEYVAQRMHELGLVHDSAYDPARPTGRNAGSLQTAAQAEQDEAVRHLGQLAKASPGVSYADDGPDPFETLAKSQAEQTARLRKGYSSGSYATHDPACLFHGRDANSQANEHTAMHGAVCTCG